jgi:hypothetical protein
MRIRPPCCLRVRVLIQQRTDFNEMWLKYHDTGDNLNVLIFDFPQSVTMT